MTFGVFLLLLFALVSAGFLRCGVEALWEGGGLSVFLRMGPLRLRAGKRAAHKKAGGGASLERKESRPDLPLFRDYTELILHLVKGALRRYRLQRLELWCCVSFPEPYDTVMAYNGLCLALQNLHHLAQDRVRDLRLQSDLDFSAGQPDVRLFVHAAFPLHFFVRWALCAYFGHHRIRRAHRRRQKG